MPLYEIVRNEDEVVVWHNAKTRKELEENFLLKLRLETPEKGYIVYKNDENLNRVGRKKEYLPYYKDKKLQYEIQERGRKAVTNFFEHALLNGFGSNGILDMDECDDCEDYDDCDLPDKTPRGEY